MNVEDLGNSRILNWLFKPAGMAMESRLRRFLMNPVKTLQGADIQPGQTVLEVGSGTGFFTMPTARMIGAAGWLIAMEPLAHYSRRISEKAQRADFRHIQVIKRDALVTGLDNACIDRVLLFGVIPFPLLPLNLLLPEMHRVLKHEGILAVWLFPPLVHGWVPRAIRQSGLFTDMKKQKGVYTFKPC